MSGKVGPDELARSVFPRTGAADDDVLVGPRYGEDAAAIRAGDRIVVVSSDPISFAADRIGTLGVYVAANDVAVCGATPRWMTVVLVLPSESDALDRIAAQLDEAARDLGVAIVGGHTEYADDRSRPLLSATCFGETDEYVASGGARPGDEIVLTNGAAIEGGAILATDFRDRLAAALPTAVIDAAADGLADVSVVRDAAVLRERASAMHDPTEGGVLTGLVEMAIASGVEFAVSRDDVPVREAVERACEAIGIDPLRTFGSGALLATVPEGEGDAAVADCREAGIDAAVIGTVRETDSIGVRLGDALYESAVRDDLYDLWS